jgi:hypothetical protein
MSGDSPDAISDRLPADTACDYDVGGIKTVCAPRILPLGRPK